MSGSRYLVIFDVVDNFSREFSCAVGSSYISSDDEFKAINRATTKHSIAHRFNLTSIGYKDREMFKIFDKDEALIVLNKIADFAADDRTFKSFSVRLHPA